MQLIENYNFKGKKAIVRVDFNVPLNANYEVTDDTRIRGALITINKIMNDGGAAILMSHLGRPKSAPEEKYSLKHIISSLSQNLGGKQIQFADNCIGDEAIEMKKNLKMGEILLLENLRFHAAEDKDKEGMKAFAQKLADGADVYVNDAFGTAHRAHASTAIIADLFDQDAKMFGYLINNELNAMDKALSKPEKPFTAIMGGAKVSDKILVIENLLNRVDNLIIGGGMTYTFIKAQRGKIGNSLCEEDKLDLALELLKKAEANGVKVYLPVDAVNADKFDANADTKLTEIDQTPDGWMGLDIGEKSIAIFTDIIKKSKTILWNGPMGVFEMEKFANGTTAIAKALAEATSSGAFTLIGGGDSVAAINKNNLADNVSYVSTGGGAMLEYIEGKVLPGIKAIRN
jgi:phosphoglycerate kinase